MRRLLPVLAISLLMLTGCDKFEDEAKGPEPVPQEDALWRSYGKMPDFETLVDINSIKHDAGYAEQNYTFVWMVQRFKDDQIDGTSKAKYRNKYLRHAIDCPSGRMAGISVSMNDSDDIEVARYEVPGFQWEFGKPQPGTFGDDYVKQICKIMAGKDAADKDAQSEE
ncbi:hypothetical protein [Chitinibacter sp. S2-10]|uniref:hypothetical protein n=1 Tax=Chitinibacter sp. S2-10 TaxID=3373597 RepID=UPI003977257F